MKNIRSCVQTLEKLSLVTCSNDVLLLLERALRNVEPILKLDTSGTEASIWQNELRIDKLHNDQVDIKLSLKDLKRNAPGYFEDYVAVGLKPAEKGHSKLE